MIFCSNLPNDQDLIKALGSMVVPCSLFTDVSFWGRGSDNTTLSVGIERKKPGDLCQCINDGRLLYQAQIAAENGIDTFIVIVEGRIRPNPDDGLLEIPCWGINPKTLRKAEIWQPILPHTTYNRFSAYISGLQYHAGITVYRTEHVKETATLIKCLWDWFQKPPDEHHSLKTIFKRPQPTISFIRPGIVRRVASELKGVGWERSRDVADRFTSVADMVSADEDDWLAVPGIGKKLAKSIILELRGAKDAE